MGAKNAYKMIQSNCSNGCPCDDYDCTVPTTTSPMATTTTTTTTTTFNPDSINTILVLDNGKSSRNDPLTIDLEGEKFGLAIFFKHNIVTVTIILKGMLKTIFNLVMARIQKRMIHVEPQ